MRPVRFVALSEDGQALVLADEVGHLLILPIDDRVSTLLRTDRSDRADAPPESLRSDTPPQLAPRDIQARIRAGESADDVARIAGVPVDRILRYAGPVLQERAMLTQHARRTRLRTSAKGATLADVVDARLRQHGVEPDKVSWDAYRRDDGTWRIAATWPSGKAEATAVWELDKARQLVTPYDDMAQFLCGAPTGTRGDAAPRRGAATRELGLPPPATGPDRDPIRAGRDALIATLERPLGKPGATVPGAGIPPTRRLDPITPAAPRRRAARNPILDEDRPAERAASHEVPAVPSLAVLRPRRNDTERVTPEAEPTVDGTGTERTRPARRGPSWDDVLFGAAPSAKDA